MQYSSMMQVPNTRNARLLNMLVRLEPEMAKVSGFHVKLVESSGVPLSRLFQRTPSRHICHWEDCPAYLIARGKRRCQGAKGPR